MICFDHVWGGMYLLYIYIYIDVYYIHLFDSWDIWEFLEIPPRVPIKKPFPALFPALNHGAMGRVPLWVSGKRRTYSGPSSNFFFMANKINGFISDTNGFRNFPKKPRFGGVNPFFLGCDFLPTQKRQKKRPGFKGPKLRSSWQVIQKLWKEKQLPRRSNSKSGNGDGSGFPSSSSTTSNDWSSLCLGL